MLKFGFLIYVLENTENSLLFLRGDLKSAFGIFGKIRIQSFHPLHCSSSTRPHYCYLHSDGSSILASCNQAEFTSKLEFRSLPGNYKFNPAGLQKSHTEAGLLNIKVRSIMEYLEFSSMGEWASASSMQGDVKAAVYAGHLSMSFSNSTFMYFIGLYISF